MIDSICGQRKKKLVVGSFLILGLIGACAAKAPKMGCSLVTSPFIISCGAMGLKSIKNDDIGKLKVIIFNLLVQ